MSKENVGDYKKLYEGLRQLYDDLKKAYDMMERRLQDRIEFLRNSNGNLIAEKVDLAKQLATVLVENRALKKKKGSAAKESGNVVRLERLIRDKDRDLETYARNLCSLRQEQKSLYDMASDAQLYAIAVERLLKAQNDPRIVWPHRPFAVSLKGIKE